MFHGEVIDERKLKFRIYIPFGRDVELLSACIRSIALRISVFTSEKRPIVIMNNTGNTVKHLIPSPELCEEVLPFVHLQHAQEVNWMIKMARENEEPFCMMLHTDAELVDGAIEDLLEKYHEVKETRWAQILQYASGVFCAVNPYFFEMEEVEFDAFLFPFYFMDNHMYQIMESRGWTVHLTRLSGQISLPHKSSHYLKDDLIFQRKNEFAFKYSLALYSEIWGGGPGAETRKNDPWANGTLKRSW